MFQIRISIVAIALAIGSTVTFAQQSIQPPAAPAVPSSPSNSASPSQSQATPTHSQSTNDSKLPITGVQNPPQSVVVKKPVMQGQGTDLMIANMLSLCNQKEVQLGTIAKQHSTNLQVKQFAEMMIRDHGEMVSALQQFGARPMNLSIENSSSLLHGSNATQRDREIQNRTATAGNFAAGSSTTSASTSDKASSHASSTGFDAFDIHREIAQKCLDEAQAEWKKKDPKESDMEYIGQQIVAHKEMIVSGKVLRNHASPELQKAIDRGIATAEEHVDQAHKLIKALSSEKSEPKDLKD